MEKFQQENPSNARIFINLKNLKNPVKFSYPNKESAEKVVRRAIQKIWLFLLSIEILIFLFITILSLLFIKNPIFNSTNEVLSNGLVQLLFISIVFFSYILIPPRILAKVFVKDESFMSKMPEINKKLALFPSGSYYYKCIDNLKSKVYELPYFDNVFLDFETSGDYSKYLERVEITEHDFEVIKKKIFTKKTKNKQDELWKARFYFKEVPKSGKLEVFYL